MKHKWFAGAVLAGAGLWSGGGTVNAADKRPIDVIEDNSFLIEEAYNQEEGVVQHIFTAAYTKSGRTHGWGFSFTQEWPVLSQTHQFSYTLPYSWLRADGDRASGIGDVEVNDAEIDGRRRRSAR